MCISETDYLWVLIATEVVVGVLFIRLVWMDYKRKKRDLW